MTQYRIVTDDGKTDGWTFYDGALRSAYRVICNVTFIIFAVFDVRNNAQLPLTV